VRRSGHSRPEDGAGASAHPRLGARAGIIHHTAFTSHKMAPGLQTGASA